MGNIIKKLKTISYIFSAFFLGALITILTIDLVLIRKDKMSLYELLSIFANLATVIIAVIAVIAIGFTVLSLKSQKKQWLNESFIKHEADILLEFRKKLDMAEKSIWFFVNDLLSIDKKYEFITDTPPVIKYDELKEHFNMLVDLNDFYNSNQNIFRKHQLEKKIECIALLLESVSHLPSKDINYKLIESKNNHQTYRMEERVLAQVLSFNSLAQSLHNIKSKEEKVEDMEKYYNDKISELNRLKEITAKELISLVFKLDELTTYVDSRMNEALKIRQMKFFQKK